jgi:hypothetical protein
MFSPIQPPTTLHTVALICTRCARPFPYHYQGLLILQRLLPIDRVCMHCLIDYVNDTVSENTPSVPTKKVPVK